MSAPKHTPTPWFVTADGEGSADTRICRTHAEIVQFLWEQCGHDHTGNEEHARNAWFTYLEDGDNWQSRDGALQFRCDIEVGETGRIEIQWMGDACNSHDALVALAEQRDGAVTEACARLKAFEVQRDALVAALEDAHDAIVEGSLLCMERTTGPVLVTSKIYYEGCAKKLNGLLGALKAAKAKP